MNTTVAIKVFPEGRRLELVQGDITLESVDAIVNAANALLHHGGGVAAVIARKGGPVVIEESRAWVQQNGPVTHERPGYTSGGNLPARYVIHAVGPVWGSGDEDTKLTAAVTGTLRMAASLELATIAMPAISTGIFRFPRRRAAGFIYRAVCSHFEEDVESSVKVVRIVLFDAGTLEDFLTVFKNEFPD